MYISEISQKFTHCFVEFIKASVATVKVRSMHAHLRGQPKFMHVLLFSFIISLTFFQCSLTRSQGICFPVPTCKTTFSMTLLLSGIRWWKDRDRKRHNKYLLQTPETTALGSERRDSFLRVLCSCVKALVTTVCTEEPIIHYLVFTATLRKIF